MGILPASHRRFGREKDEFKRIIFTNVNKARVLYSLMKTVVYRIRPSLSSAQPEDFRERYNVIRIQACFFVSQLISATRQRNASRQFGVSRSFYPQAIGTSVNRKTNYSVLFL